MGEYFILASFGLRGICDRVEFRDQNYRSRGKIRLCLKIRVNTVKKSSEI